MIQKFKAKGKIILSGYTYNLNPRVVIEVNLETQKAKFLSCFDGSVLQFHHEKKEISLRPDDIKKIQKLEKKC